MAEVPVTMYCLNCGSELTVTVGLQAPVLGCGPIDYCEVVGPEADRCPECGDLLDDDFFAEAAEEALEEKREYSGRFIRRPYR